MYCSGEYCSVRNHQNDSQQNDILHNDTQKNDILQNGTQHSLHNDTQQNDIQQNDILQNYTQQNDILQNGTQHYKKFCEYGPCFLITALLSSELNWRLIERYKANKLFSQLINYFALLVQSFAFLHNLADLSNREYSDVCQYYDSS
jgi:hypothetical protein